MSVSIKLKHSSVDGKAPVPADLENGELALNINENSPAAYIKDSNGDIVKLAGAGSVTDATNVKKAGDTMTGPLVLYGDPTANDQASNKKYVDDVAANAVVDSDAKYVEVAGDNMTGDLTLGTDKITLDATDGNITAAGDIVFTPSAAVSGPGNKITWTTEAPFLDEVAGIVASRNSTGNAATELAFLTGGGAAGPPATALKLLSDRSAEFAGGVTANYLDISNPSTSSSAWVSRVTTGNGLVHQVFADGSATFAGVVGAEGTGTSARLNPIGQLFVRNNGGVAVEVRNVADPTNIQAQINGDGSAEFAGSVQSNQFRALDTSLTNQTYFIANKIGLYYGGNVSGGSANTTINADGSASFAGSVTTGALSTEKNNTATNYIWRKTDKVGDALCRFKSDVASLPGGDAATIFADGSASFKGKQDIDLPLGEGQNAVAFQSGFGGNPNIQLFTGGAATFTGTVTANVVPPSDARFKENIAPAKPQLADVVALGGLLKNYDWNDDAPLNEEIRSQRQLGLIAQEAAEVCPAIVKDIHRTKQGAVITPEEIIPAVYEEKVIPAEYETVVTPAKLGPRGKEIVPASTEEVLVTPERTEQVLVEEERVIPATYETLDDSYKGISSEALIMKLIGAVTELSAEVTALKAAKLTKN